MNPRMKISPMKLFLLFLFLASVKAVEYLPQNNAPGTTGGMLFDIEIGVRNAKTILSSASHFIWHIFQQPEGRRKDIHEVEMTIESLTGVAYTRYNQIHVSTEYIARYNSSGINFTKEVKGILYHEMTHVWQWNGKRQVPVGLIEGLADYVRLKAGLAKSTWVKRGAGERWDQGYARTAYFLEYCESLKHGFVAEINSLMKDGYGGDRYFVQLLGKSVDELWKDYKAKYNH